MGSRGWLDRYLAGRRREVWHELRQVGAAVRAPDVIEEAQLVCDHMAIRARQNVEVIVSRLAEQGYRFHANDDDDDDAGRSAARRALMRRDWPRAFRHVSTWCR